MNIRSHVEMSAIKSMLKGWVKVLPLCLVALLPLFASCSEADDTVEEYADWQTKNETYFEQQLKAHLVSSSTTSFVLKKLSLADTVSVDKADPEDCILVDVLEHGDDGASPLYTDTVMVHYLGRLIPSPSYPQGYQFDSSYQGDFDAAVAVPAQLTVKGVVEGFATALQHMHRGDYWRVTIPYPMAYGTSGSSTIPGYSTLIFDLRLDDFY